MSNDDTTGSAAAAPNPTPGAAAAPAPAQQRSRASRGLVITGIALASVAILGVTFAAGVGLGRILPGPGGPLLGAWGAGHGGDRGDRFEELLERRDQLLERRDDVQQQYGENGDERRELFEQWLEQQEQNG